MVGQIYQFPMTTRRDSITGLEVIRLSDNKAHYDRPYFTSPQFSSDSRFTIFVSDFSGTSKIKDPNAPAIGKIGFGELFLLELATGKATQLTQGEAIKMGHGAHAMLAPSGKKAFFYSNTWLCCVDIETFKVEKLIQIPITWNFHSLTFSCDERYLAFSVVEELPLLTASFANPFAEFAPGARERYFNEPRSLVLRYDLVDHKAEVVYGGHVRITHTSINPKDSDQMIFCHDGPWHLVQRIWTVRVSTDEVAPLFKQRHNLEGVVHEFFTPYGRVGAQYSFRYKPDMPFFQFADLYMDPDGKNEERYYYPYKRPGHVGVRFDGLYGVGDAAMLSADMPDWEKYLSLITYDRQHHTATCSILCRHDTSGRKFAHVHPVFTPDGKHVVFSSDCDGKLNIYMVAANPEKAVAKL